MKKLPEEFLKRMKELLKDEEEYEAFLKSYEEKPQRGIRLNLTKLKELSYEDREKIYDTLTGIWGLEPLPEATFCELDGRKYYREFYINEDVLEDKGIRPGRHPYHEAGLYYIQEPAAMQVVMHMDIQPGDRVADLCASPGGKSTHAADFLSVDKGGILLSNEFVGNRARVLSSNIERMGIINALVLNEDTKRIAEYFPGYFTRVIIDAPCSGEGMFRKDDTAIEEWSLENVRLCVERQKEIVENGVKLLADGGKISYSTCTFEREEDEDIANYILSLDSSLKMIYEKRVFPHRERGEGHYIAIFEKEGTKRQEDFKAKIQFFQEKEKNRISLIPNSLPDTGKLRLLRKGVFKENTEKKREEPEHAYSHCRLAADDYPTLKLSADDERVWRYMEGQEIEADRSEIQFLSEKMEQEFKKGFILILVDGLSLGFGKYVQGRVKNGFPKGLRFQM